MLRFLHTFLSFLFLVTSFNYAMSNQTEFLDGTNYPESEVSNKIKITTIDGVEYCGTINDEIKTYINQRDFGYPYREMYEYYEQLLRNGEIEKKHIPLLEKMSRSLSKDKINPEYIKILKDLSFNNSLCASNLLSYLFFTEQEILSGKKASYYALQALEIQLNAIDNKRVVDYSDFAIPLLASKIIDNFNNFKIS